MSPLLASISTQLAAGLAWLLGAGTLAVVLIRHARATGPGGDDTLLENLEVTALDDAGRPEAWRAGHENLPMQVASKLLLSAAALVMIGMSLVLVSAPFRGLEEAGPTAIFVGLSLTTLLFGGAGIWHVSREPWTVRRETQLTDGGVLLRTHLGILRPAERIERLAWSEVSEITLYELEIQSYPEFYKDWYVRLDLVNGRKIVLGGSERLEQVDLCLESLVQRRRRALRAGHPSM